jgi:HlyD family secretion protein
MKKTIKPLLLAALLAVGCTQQPPAAPPVQTTPRVQVAKVQERTIKASVSQPGFIYAYEQTALYPKVSGYLAQWNVDIGDPIHKGDVLATIDVPELVAQYKKTKAEVAFDEVMVGVSQQLVQVAQSNIEVAAAQAEQAQSEVGKYTADVELWKKQVDIVKSAGAAIDKQNLEAALKQVKSSEASVAAAKSAVTAFKATQQAKEAELAKAKVDVQAAEARVKVAQAEEQRLKALVGYTKIVAPYDGRVVVRNANTGDYVQPATGDLSPAQGTPDQPAMRGTPIFVVARTDKVRIYVNVPERDADYVDKKTKASVRIASFSGAEIEAPVARTSWSVGVKTRTLRVEIDLPNPDERLLPGMYAYGKLLIDRPKVLAVPAGAITVLGNQPCVYLLEKGHAVKTPVQAGVSDGKWTEVTGKQVNGEWVAFSVSDEVIVSDLGELVDGEAVVQMK